MILHATEQGGGTLLNTHEFVPGNLTPLACVKCGKVKGHACHQVPYSEPKVWEGDYA
jgi:hypothetical protein